MASWKELRDHVVSNYKVQDDQGFMMTLNFDVGENRSQLVFLLHQTLREGSEHWVRIESAIGDLSSVPLIPLLREVDQTICGGIGAVQDLVTFRHSVPLENLDLNEFERPLMLVVATADRLEHKLVGGDRY